MAHTLYLDPVTGDDVYCNEDEERARARHWKEVAALLAELILEDNEESKEYARKVINAVVRGYD